MHIEVVRMDQAGNASVGYLIIVTKYTIKDA